MNLDQRFKTLLGEYAFTVTALQHQVEELTKELETFKSKEIKNETNIQ